MTTTSLTPTLDEKREATFDLVSEPWIDVLDTAGQYRCVGLRELFAEADAIAAVQMETPVQTCAVLRLAEAISYRITGLDQPIGAQQWHARRNELLQVGAFDTDAVASYLNKHSARFDLFDSVRPFGQDPRLADENVKVNQIGKLVPDIPAGNNVAWFSQAHDSVSPQVAASWLVVALMFSAGGAWSTRHGEKFVTMAPPRGVVSYHLDGPTLFVSLLANLVLPTTPAEPAPWETDLPAVDVGATLTTLVDPVNRTLGRWRHAFLLEWVAAAALDGSGAAVEVVGVRPTWAHRRVEEVDDPHLTYFAQQVGKTKVERRVKNADPIRALWRDIVALVRDPNVVLDDGGVGLEVVTHLDGIADEVRDVLRVRAFGFATDKSADIYWWESSTPTKIASWIVDDLDRYDAAATTVDLAETQAKAIRRAFGQISKDTSDQTTTRDAVIGRFFEQAETVFWDAVRDASADGVTRRLRRFALDTFDDYTGHLLFVPQHAAAIAKARKKVIRALPSEKAAS